MTNYYIYQIRARYYGKESPINTLILNAATSREDAKSIVLDARKLSKQTIVEEVIPLARTSKPCLGLELCAA